MAKKKEETPDLFETPVTEDVAAVEPPKKKRGRPSKAELAAREEAAKAAAEKEQPAPEAPAAEEMATTEEAPMDYAEAPAEAEMVPESEMMDNPQDEFGFWEGDQGDGTDFIIIQDIPVEDNGAIPYYDMFDNAQTGDSYYNMELSSMRANTITDILQREGISNNRLMVCPNGSSIQEYNTNNLNRCVIVKAVLK
jgi:transcription termination factor Rho